MELLEQDLVVLVITITKDLALLESNENASGQVCIPVLLSDQVLLDKRFEKDPRDGKCVDLHISLRILV